MTPIIMRFCAGLIVVYGTLFGLGNLILGNGAHGWGLLILAGVLLGWIIRSGHGE